ncbi:MAG: PLP-dependent transferase [Chitinophagia bacterium]|nr:PLP-dependent transferase [Chitinophagia bacterium]
MKKDTQYIHAGSHPDPSTGAIMTPIYQTSTYVQEAPGVNKGFEYARSQNPTRQAVIAGSDMYGGTYRLFSKIFEKFGIVFHYVDMSELTNIEKKISTQTKLIWVETPTNPLMNIADIEAIARISSKNKLLLCVDNTFASPALQNPLNLGADIVMHSATKYLSGHSDVIQGALIVNDKALRDELYFIQKSCGAVPGPMDCFLVLRGIKTLGIRMERHSKNGEAIATFLHSHPAVKKVYWPGFESHPGHAIAKRQMKSFGGMISFELKNDSIEAARTLLSNTKLFSLAESLGGVESLINHPASMTHASIPREERIKNGLSDTLIRLSVGIEDAGDLIDDLNHAIQLAEGVK